MLFKLPEEKGRLIEYINSVTGYVEVKKKHERRTLSQNDYLHVIFTIIANDIGHTKEEIKEIYKQMFLSYYTELNDKKIKVVRSTADLDKREMTEFIEKIRNHAAAELGIYVPAPDEITIKDLHILKIKL
jgi:hypothetical protein